MLVTNLPKIILHMPRCGGSSIRWAVMSTDGVEYKYSIEHANIDALPEKYKDIPTMAIIRNPIDWYVSWYYKTKETMNNIYKLPACPFMVVLSDKFNLNFHQTLPRLLNIKGFLDKNPEYVDRIRKYVKSLLVSRHLSWIATYFDDVSEITADDFDCSLFDWYYRTLGLDRCSVIYKLEDGLFTGLKKEFPELEITERR